MREDEKEKGFSSSLPVLLIEVCFLLAMSQEEKETGFFSSLPILLICFLLASNERGGEGERFLFFSPRSSNGSLLSLGFQ